MSYLENIIASEYKYRLLPFRFIRLGTKKTNDVLITSETGEYLFTTEEKLNALINKKIPKGSWFYKALLARHFIYEPEGHNPIQEMAAQYKSRKSFLVGGPALHIFVVTLRCNHTCQYCQVSRAPVGGHTHDMSEYHARLAVDRMFESPSPALTVEFQGGEPLLSFERIKQIIEYISEKNAAEKRDIQYVISSTLHHINDEILTFSKVHGIQFSTSLDGPNFLHNTNRPTPEKNSYERTLHGIEAVRSELGHDNVSALTTLTSKSLLYPEEIIDEYVKIGFNSISLRPLSPYGFAKKSSQRLDYSVNEYLKFYKRALDHLIKINSEGTFIAESYTSLLLSSIMTPFSSGYVDLRSPLGAGLGALIYNYDGGVYPSDEARMLKEMGESDLMLGTLDQPLEQLLTSVQMEILLSSGIIEGLPGCTDCAYLPYCGADPVEHYARSGDPIGHRSFSDFCTRNMGLLTHLFTLLRDGERSTQRVLVSWLTRRSFNDISSYGCEI